jgi:hypothetical protein
MPQCQRISCFAYGLLLSVYPSEFRRRFGVEMRQVFADQLNGEGSLRGILGVLSVWRSAGWEILSVAVPLQLCNSTVIAGALSFVLSSALCLAFFRAVSR